MWGVVRKCAECRREFNVNGSACELNKSFLLGLWEVLSLGPLQLAHCSGESRNSSDFTCQQEKSEVLRFSVLSLENEGTRLISRLHQENERGEENPEPVPWRCNIAATHVASFCTRRLSKYDIHFTCGRWAAPDDGSVYELSKMCFLVLFLPCWWNLLRQRSKSLGRNSQILYRHCCVSW